MPVETTVDTPSLAYSEMSVAWPLIDALDGGTRAMRAGGKLWLPKEKEEDEVDYEARLNRSILYTAFKDTVGKLSAKPFSKPVTLSEGLPAQMEGMEANIDFRGTNLTQLARHMFEDSMRYGLTHLFVDFPATGGGLNLAEERATGARPYFVHVKAQDLIAWKSERQNDGTQKLTHIRFKETRTEDEGEFGEIEVQYIRVVDETTWQLWRRLPTDSEYNLHDAGTHTFNGVPLVTFHTDEEAFMVAEPPLEGLAWLNLAHWQSSSDQRNILRFARLGILFGAGFSAEELEKGIVIGPSQLTGSTNPEATLQYVEHGGKAMEAGDKDLDRLENQMEVQGLQPLVQSTGNSTALGRGLDEARTHSNIQAWIGMLENTLLQAFTFAAGWINKVLPEDFKVSVFSEFSVAFSGTEDIRTLILLRDKGAITHATLLKEVKRRGMLGDDVDVEAEIEALAKEIPPGLDFQDKPGEEDGDGDGPAAKVTKNAKRQ